MAVARAGPAGPVAPMAPIPTSRSADQSLPASCSSQAGHPQTHRQIQAASPSVAPLLTRRNHRITSPPREISQRNPTAGIQLAAARTFLLLLLDRQAIRAEIDAHALG